MDNSRTEIVRLNGKNYATWKTQCRMLLLKEGLWEIVTGAEEAPADDAGADVIRQFKTRKNRALAIVTLAVETWLLYHIDDMTEPKDVWTKLQSVYQKKSWWNQYHLERRLFSMKLRDDGSVNEHLKAMSEIFRELAVIGEAVPETKRVSHLLASLPDSFDTLVTALQGQSDEAPKWDVVTERLLQEEQRRKDRSTQSAPTDERKVLFANRSRSDRRPQRSQPASTKPNADKVCHYCKNKGHIKRDCWKLAKALKKRSEESKGCAAVTSEPDSESDESGLHLAGLPLAMTTSAGVESWIIDSGSTSHMCNNKSLFTALKPISRTLKVTLADGHRVEATDIGTVTLELLLPDATTKQITLTDVLYLPKLSCNLLSVPRAFDAGLVLNFSRQSVEILDEQRQVVGIANRVGSLYHLEFCRKQQANVADKSGKERLWHRRYGHLGEQNLKNLATQRMVQNFDYDPRRSIGFCESCVGGKHHRNQFNSSTRQTREPLELVHSDVCGKISEKSLGGAEYFLTFTDDKTRYSWVYTLKSKDQVYVQFREWKAQVEKSSGKRLKTLRTDNGGEYVSKEFESYLKSEGIHHELTVPKTPEQNGVAERLNHTLVETARSMLLDAKLSKKFWGEAVFTAVYLKNRSPSRSLKGLTPYEAWFGKKPQVNHLRVFGCNAYAHVPKDERSKFDSKARKCILVGYSKQSKAYRLYDPQRKKLVVSRDVKFDEKERDPIETGSETELRDQYTIIETGDSNTRFETAETNQRSETAENDQQPQLRRSSRVRNPPQFYGREATHLCDVTEPTTFGEAVKSPIKQKWIQAMEKEMNSLFENDVYDLVELPPNHKAIGSKWVYKVKTGADGSIERYKARLVAKGFSQKVGMDYDETFCPVVRQESLRTLIAIAQQKGMKLHQVDVSTAFLNGLLEEEVYMQQPPGFIKEGEEHLVCKLNKSIYGLKQAPRCWNMALDAYLKELRFEQTKSDPCIYVSTEGETFYLGVYVDDIVLAGTTEERIREIKNALSRKFEIKDIGKLHYFLGMTIKQTDEKIWIGQPKYTENLLKKFGMQDCKPVSTPVEPGQKLEAATDRDLTVDQQKYQSAIGSLMYLSVCTRPDISFAVGNLAKFSSQPTKHHWNGLKHLSESYC